MIKTNSFSHSSRRSARSNSRFIRKDKPAVRRFSNDGVKDTRHSSSYNHQRKTSDSRPIGRFSSGSNIRPSRDTGVSVDKPANRFASRPYGKFTNRPDSKPAGRFTSRPASRFSGRPTGRPTGRPVNRSGRTGGRFSQKTRGSRMDFSRFIKKAEHIEEKPHIPKYNFSDFPFDNQIHKNISSRGYSSPRPIQDETIPKILEGKDVFGLANTGTGKTAAFLLPFIDIVMKDRNEKVLVLAPTRELALQIEEELRGLASGSRLYGVAVVGGLPIMKQIREIKSGVSFVIGTPGRVTDLIKRKVLDLSSYKRVVLDEADRMLDMGFRDDMVFILGKTSPERQTLCFSATLSPEVKKLTAQFLKVPVFISVIKGETAKNIDQDVIHTRTKEEKLEKLEEVLRKEDSGKFLIFRERKHHVDSLAKELAEKGFKVAGIHGDKRSRERIRILDSFKKDRIKILIATDVAARGLDIPLVTHVINYDIPENYDTYVHRIGRTGRNGKKGIALTFV